MDHEETVRRCYELLNAGDVDGFGDLLSDDFVEHEETPGLEPTKDGVKAFFRMYIAAFPDLRWIRKMSCRAATRSWPVSGRPAPIVASSWACLPPGRVSMWS